MSDGAGMSAADAGGIIGGAVTLLGAVGGGIAWLFGRSDQRRSEREAKLATWHEELEAREKRLDEGRTAYITRLEERVTTVEASERAREAKDEARDLQLTALRLAFEIVSGALRAIDQHNSALARAEDVLRAAFPVKPTIAADMMSQLVAIDAADSRA